MTEGHPLYRSTEDERMFESTFLKMPEAHTRAKEVLLANQISLKPFETLYDKNVLKADREEVARLQEKFDHTPSEIYADILEAIICEHGELSNWFGAKSEVMKTLPLDDYQNKVDLIVETTEEGGSYSHLTLGVDVTFGSRNLEKKFAYIKTRIEAGKLGEVKYFHSDRQHFTGRLQKVPLVVIGVEIEHAKELGLLWMNRRNRELGEHSMQVLILEEIALQLKAFAEYAREIHKEDLVSILEKELRKIHELLVEKRVQGIKTPASDKVFNEIKRNLLAFRV